MMKRFLSLLALPLLMAGCAARFNNLTPQTVERNQNGLYPVEVSMKCQQQNLDWDSIRAYVLVGDDSIPMHRVPVITNRWEASIPVSQANKIQYYQCKFDYDYYSYGKLQKGSALTQVYRFKILDK
jgi:hypothetical protein